MAVDLSTLRTSLTSLLDDKLVSIEEKLGELTVVVRTEVMLETLLSLRDAAEFRFEQMMDLCGMDYSTYGSDISDGGAYFSADDAQDADSRHSSRFAVVYHLLSLANNTRLRVCVYAQADDLPILPSVIDIWPAANWYEREAFDLYGIVFTGHPDLRRILTDYGFVGNPFRKDFPLSGHVEMRYDPEQKRVVYQPVSVEPREVTPRIVREENYANASEHK